MKILLVEAILTKFSRVKDGSVNLSFRTMREMDNEEFAVVDQYFQQNGHLAFKLDEITVDDIPTENTQVQGQRSPSQTLRMKIFALHMQKGGTKENFTPYYQKVMAHFEQSVQDQIEALKD